MNTTRRISDWTPDELRAWLALSEQPEVRAAIERHMETLIRPWERRELEELAASGALSPRP